MIDSIRAISLSTALILGLAGFGLISSLYFILAVTEQRYNTISEWFPKIGRNLSNTVDRLDTLSDRRLRLIQLSIPLAIISSGVLIAAVWYNPLLPPTTFLSITVVSVTIVSFSVTIFTFESLISIEPNFDQDFYQDVGDFYNILNDMSGEETDPGEFLDQLLDIFEELNKDISKEVDADSIPELLTDTHECANEIEENLGELKSVIDDTHDGTGAVERKLDQLADDLSDFTELTEELENNASSIDNHVDEIREFADSDKIENIKSSVSAVDNAAEKMVSSSDELENEIKGLSGEIGGFEDAVSSLARQSDELSTVQNQLKHMVAEPFASDHFEKVSIESILKDSEWTAINQIEFDAPWVISIEIGDEEDSLIGMGNKETPLIVVIEQIDIHSDYREIIEQDEISIDSEESSRIRNSIKADLDEMQSSYLEGEKPHADVVLAYFETENLYQYVTRLFTMESGMSDGGSLLQEYAENGLMIVSPSTLQVRLLGIEQEAKAWHWYRTAVEARDKLNTLQESVDSLFTEVNTVREDIDEVTTELSVERPEENQSSRGSETNR